MPLNEGMDTPRMKTGRPRRYDLQPPEGFADRDLGLAVALLRELAERVYDQIEDLPLEALDFLPAGTTLSISRLTLHMAWAEANWVRRLTGAEPAPGLQAELETARLDRFTTPPDGGRDAAGLIAVCRRTQETYSAPALRDLRAIDAALPIGDSVVTMRGVMSQLAWHWTYHSGQIGLLRLLWGSDYEWTMDRKLGTPR